MCEGHKLVGATQGTDAVTLEIESPDAGRTTVEARFVIGADGMWSPLRRGSGLDTPGYRGEWHAFRQYVHGVSPPRPRTCG